MAVFLTNLEVVTESWNKSSDQDRSLCNINGIWAVNNFLSLYIYRYVQ